MPNKNHNSELDSHYVSTCSFVTHVNSTQTTIICLIQRAIKHSVVSSMVTIHIRPGQVNSQFIVTARMLLNTAAWNFIIGISDRNTLIEQSLCSNRVLWNMKNDLPPAWLFEISLTINCELTWHGLIVVVQNPWHNMYILYLKNPIW